MAASRLPAETLDGVHVTLLANIEKAEEVSQAKDCQAEAWACSAPSTFTSTRRICRGRRSSFATYKAVAEGVRAAAVVIRTLDLGGDSRWRPSPA